MGMTVTKESSTSSQGTHPQRRSRIPSSSFFLIYEARHTLHSPPSSNEATSFDTSSSSYLYQEKDTKADPRSRVALLHHFNLSAPREYTM
ncbi:hypothetical protein GOBAR_AA36305 [Gossypium barbadense]|uniref:Uncharacterized protein n=1 Tax=Gossypium barbadense TaxID=3634 RepID=A0A2P5W004_GOSBA|nr:hypothetical protein GOBAR_AA36305 [Gossypium barbadense]